MGESCLVPEVTHGVASVQAERMDEAEILREGRGVACPHCAAGIRPWVDRGFVYHVTPRSIEQCQAVALRTADLIAAAIR
jgi:hypothetical protein